MLDKRHWNTILENKKYTCIMKKEPIDQLCTIFVVQVEWCNEIYGKINVLRQTFHIILNKRFTGWESTSVEWFTTAHELYTVSSSLLSLGTSLICDQNTASLWAVGHTRLWTWWNIIVSSERTSSTVIPFVSSVAEKIRQTISVKYCANYFHVFVKSPAKFMIFQTSF